MLLFSSTFRYYKAAIPIPAVIVTFQVLFKFLCLLLNRRLKSSLLMIYNSWKSKRAIFNGPKMLKLRKNNEEIKKERAVCRENMNCIRIC